MMGCQHKNLMRHDYHGEIWWQCDEGCDLVFRAAQPSEAAGVFAIKGPCAKCGKLVQVRSGEAWHSKGDKVWHEVCSYQETIEQLRAELAAAPNRETELRDLAHLIEEAGVMLADEEISCKYKHVRTFSVLSRIRELLAADKLQPPSETKTCEFEE